jgi:YVTN family beta-propeller protein
LFGILRYIDESKAQDNAEVWVSTKSFIFVIFATAFVTGPAYCAGLSPPAYTLVETIPLGAGERWDYVTFDPATNRVFVSHGDHVTVVDAQTRAIVGEIGTLPGGTHGIGIAADSGRGYTDDGKAGTIAAFDLKTLKVQSSLAGKPDADGIVFDSASGHIFVIEGDSGTISVIDPKANSVAATITVGSGLEAGAADGAGKLYVDGADAHDIVEIDSQKNTVVAHWPMPGCVRPHGIALDAVARRIFSTCANKQMVILDADTGRIVATMPIGTGSDGAAFDPVRKLAYSSNGEGTLSVIHEIDPDHFVALDPVPTAKSARTIAIDPRTGRVFLPAADIAKIDPPSTPGGRPHVTFVPNSLKLLVYAPQ